MTEAPGYDAEGSYSPDGQWIAFASNRRAYDGSMTAEEKVQFDLRQSLHGRYLPDESRWKRIQAADRRRRLRWRTVLFSGWKTAFAGDILRQLETAEIMTMNVDGGDPRQLTRLNALSWAPYYHPSGQVPDLWDEQAWLR